jgi:hypothetical protein
VQVQPERLEFCPKALQDLRKVIVQHDCWSRDTQLRRTVLAQPFGNDIDIFEERSNKLKKLCPCWREREWPPLKQLGAE